MFVPRYRPLTLRVVSSKEVVTCPEKTPSNWFQIAEAAVEKQKPIIVNQGLDIEPHLKDASPKPLTKNKRKRRESTTKPQKKSKKSTSAFPLLKLSQKQATECETLSWFIGLDISATSPGMVCRHPASKTIHLVFFVNQKKIPQLSKTTSYTFKPEAVHPYSAHFHSFSSHTKVKRGRSNAEENEISRLCSPWFTWKWPSPLEAALHEDDNSLVFPPYERVVMHRIADSWFAYQSPTEQYWYRAQALVDVLDSIIHPPPLAGKKKSFLMPPHKSFFDPLQQQPTLSVKEERKKESWLVKLERNMQNKKSIHISLEDYTFHNKESSSVSALCEMTGIVKMFLEHKGFTWTPYSNTTAKMQFSGHGRAIKHLMWRACVVQFPQVIHAIEKEFGYSYEKQWFKFMDRRKKQGKSTRLDEKHVPIIPAPNTDLVDALALSFLL